MWSILWATLKIFNNNLQNKNSKILSMKKSNGFQKDLVLGFNNMNGSFEVIGPYCMVAMNQLKLCHN
jgi:hypothetical protein